MKSEELDRLELLAHSSGIRVALMVAYESGKADGLMEAFGDITDTPKVQPTLVEILLAQVQSAEKKAEA